MSLGSRRKPWPDDVQLGGTGLMLRPGADGLLVARKVQSLDNVAPTTQEYSSEPVYRGRTFVFGRLTGGMGERVQSSHTSKRYRYGLNVWCAGGLVGKGPLLHRTSPGSTGAIRGFPEALNGGVLTQFVLAGRYVLEAATGAVSKDFGASKATQTAVRFKNAGGTVVDALYVTLDNTELWQYDGTTWTQMGSTVTIPAQYVERVGDELWKAHANRISKCTGDPSDAAQWSAEITIGDASSSITALKNVHNRLVIFKADGGVYTVNGQDSPASGTDNDLFPGLRVTPSSANGQMAEVWLDSAWFRQGDSFYRLDVLDGATLTPVGPERLAENDSEVRGAVTCAAGWGTNALYLGVYNATSGHSYLLQYGDWQPVQGSADAAYHFAEVIHGALAKWTSQQITALETTTVYGGNTRLYAGFADGTYDYLLLPRHGANPFAADSGCEFSTGSSTLYVPLHHAMFQADYKVWQGFAAFGPTLTATEYVQLGYRTDPGAAAYTALGANFTTSGQQADAPANTVSRVLDVAVTLVNTATSATPVLEGIGIREQIRPALRLDQGFTVKAATANARRDGTTSRLTAEQIRELVKAAAAAPGSVTLLTPDEASAGFAVIDYAERLAPDERRYGLAWDLDVKLTQYRTNTTYGVVGRLKPYLIGDLAPFTLSQLGTL